MTDNVWSKFDSYREMKVTAGGRILVVRPADIATTVPLFCPLCKFPLKTVEDSIEYRRAQCCEKCFLFCRGKKEEMPPGQWEEYLDQRQILAKPLITLR